MIAFKNEICAKEWIFGSLIITIMIWSFLLFPRVLSVEELSLAKGLDLSNRFIEIISGIIFLSGTLIWAFSPVDNEYVSMSGASALVYGLFAYIICRTIYNRDAVRTIGITPKIKSSKLILINFWVSFVSLSFVLVYWKTIEEGMLIKLDGVSMYGHLFGFLSGMLIYVIEIAYLLLLSSSVIFSRHSST